MVSTLPDNSQIAEFWDWFAGKSDAIAANLEDGELLEQLNERLSQLGVFGWEIGPGSTARYALAISPDGDADRLPLTRRVVARAPKIRGWEFLPARPPRDPSMEFVLESPGGGGKVAVDARDWRYVLYRADERFDIVLEQTTLEAADEEDRYVASVLLLDGVLGEETRLALIRDVEPVAHMTSKQSAKANSVRDLATHLQRVRGTTQRDGGQ